MLKDQLQLLIDGYSWLLAVEDGVRELDFENITDENKVYMMPRAIFSANSVTNLRLVRCRLEQPFDSIMLHSFKKLTLVVLYNLDELSECSPSLPLQVENLELHTNVPLSNYETLLDCVFWICHPSTLRVNVMFEEDHKFIAVY
ncbi:hypothetical protein WN944_013998 [Citrus x changshan-huyou]|uniref:Uncharacterized protein n=1 Tax=Citrus x changshan-huyou TaxID=2935761 RepID=A0AAP0M699_9ROSI